RPEGIVELFVKREPPALDIFPGNVASAYGQELVPVLIHPEWNEAVPQDDNSREQQANQMHHVLPADLAAIPEILFQLLKLREHVRVVSAMDVLREKDMPQVNQFLRQWRARLHERRVEAFQDVRIRL